MDKKEQSIRRKRILLFLVLAAILGYSLWMLGGLSFPPDFHDANFLNFLKWSIPIFIAALLPIIGLVNLILPSPPSGSTVDNTNRILRQTSPEQLISDHVPGYDEKITWIDRGVLTAAQLHIDHKILLVGRMNSGKSREIAEFIRKGLEDGTFVSSCVYDITRGMSALDPKLITETVRNELDRGQRVVFYVNDLPRQVSGKQLEVLDAYLKALKDCSPGYFLATARSDHLAANAPLKSWLFKNQVASVELPSLNEDQTGQLVEELASLHGFQWEPNAKQTLCGHMDGTPYHPIRTFKNLKTKLANSDSKVITEELARDASKESAQMTWLDFQGQIKDSEALAAELFEALAVFYVANIRAHPAICKAYTRSLVFAHHKWPLFWGFKQRWEKVLEMLKKDDIEFQKERVKFPDAAAEAAIEVLCEKGKLCPSAADKKGSELTIAEAIERLEKFASSYRRWLRNAWLRRFNAQADAQQNLLFDLAVKNYFTGKIDEALKLLKQATRVTEPSAPVWYNLGVLHYKKGDKEGAEEAWRKAVAADEKESAAWYNLGLLLDNKGDKEGAEQAYRAAVAADEKLAPAWYNLGLLLDKKGDPVGAEEAWRKAVAADEKDAPAWSNLGVLLKDKGDLVGAEQAYCAAVKADEKYAKAWSNLGLLLKDKGDLVGAEEAWRKAVAADEKLAPAWYNLGVLLDNKGDLEGAEQAYRAAVKADEKFAPAWSNLGVLLKDKGDLVGAEQAYRAAVAADQKYADGWYNLGVLLEENHDLVGAEQAYRAAVAADEKYADGWSNLGVLLQNKGDLEGAEQAYHAAVAADEKLAPAWYNLGVLLKDKGDLVGAEEAWRKAVAADEKLAPAWYNLGVLLRMTKRFSEALPVLQKLVALRPERGYDHAQLGSVYQKLGRTTEAQTEFAAARSLMSSETPYNQACIAALIGET